MRRGMRWRITLPAGHNRRPISSIAMSASMSGLHNSVSISGGLGLLVMQHRVLDPKHERLPGVREHEVYLPILAFRGGPVQPCRHRFEEALDRGLREHVDEARAIDALLWRTIAQLHCRRQVAISPRGGLGHITH